MLEVRRARSDDWPIVRETRLRALADSPQAFGSTLAREQSFDEAEWRRRIEQNCWVLARSAAGRPVGIAAGIPDREHPGAVHLVSMWVAPEARGSTAAAQLVEAVAGWARTAGNTSVTLWVTDGNDRARRFYARTGFLPTGRRRPSERAPEIGQDLLCRPLAPPAPPG